MGRGGKYIFILFARRAKKKGLFSVACGTRRSLVRIKIRNRNAPPALVSSGKVYPLH